MNNTRGIFEMPGYFKEKEALVKLDRPYTLKLFHALRELGIRAHIWP